MRDRGSKLRPGTSAQKKHQIQRVDLSPGTYSVFWNEYLVVVYTSRGDQATDQRMEGRTK